MPSKEIVELKNPERKSLKELNFAIVDDDGVKRNVPALDKHWAPRSIFGTYNSLVVTGGYYKQDAALHEWQHDAENFKQDMEFLLGLKHHEFWSYMVYQKSALASVVSFLQKATPFYISICENNKPATGIMELYDEILNLVIRILCRTLTPKESNENWIKKSDLRDLIYKNYLVSVPMLFDLVVAVGNANQSNTELLRRIFETLLNIEPNYKKDLLAGLAFFRTAFRSIHSQTENEGFEGAGGGQIEESLDATPFDDVALYTLDCAFTLSVLLDVCPAVRAYSSEIKLAQNIANFYDTTLPFLYKNIFVINESSKSLIWLNQARLQLLKAFRSISYSYVESVLIKNGDTMSITEEFIGLMTECLSEQIFVVDYERHYPLMLDFEILKQACPKLDSFKANFIMEGYQRECAAAINNENQEIYENDLQLPKPNVQEVKEETPANSNGIPKVLKEQKTERDLELEVIMILDCLPHLGTGFIRKLLERYDNTEEAIAAVLEGNLPPDLAQADQTEVYIPPDPQDKIYKETGVQHYNVYDGDKYDVMTQDNPQCIIKQGKGMPNRAQNANQLLDDKSELAAIKHRYQEYALVTENDADDDPTSHEYDDEYDDSYEALLESETRVVKSKDMKKVLANVIDESEEDEGSDSDEDNSSKDQNRRTMNFCENPEDIRARYEARRQAKWAHKNHNNVPQPQQQQQQPRDVVGKAKGQGQEKEVLRNRQKKEANKSSRANHNRKAGAAFKRSKGML